MMLSAAVVCATAGAVLPPTLEGATGQDENQANSSELQRQLKAIEAATAEVTDLQADFIQRRYTPLLKRPMVSKGTVVAVENRMRWDTVSPSKSSMLVGPTSIELFYPADALIEVYPVDRGFMDLAGVPMPKLSGLQARFDIYLLTTRDLDSEADPEQFLAIELIPKTQDLRDYVTSVKMLIDQHRSLATKVIMTGPDGDRTAISFSNIQINTGIDATRTHLSAPEGTRRVMPMGDASADVPEEAVR
jgi:outer membrane lipoprotein-sorting protein